MIKRHCIINTENQKITDKINEYGYRCTPTQKSANVSEPVSMHADVLYLNTGYKIYVSDCQSDNIALLRKSGYNIETIKLSPGYKTECLLNIVITDNTIIYNPSTSMKTDDFSDNRTVISVKQGYTKCSTVVMNNNNFITEDEGIYRALKAYGMNCLLIEKGEVMLKGYDYGFIGGASVYLSQQNTLLFFGDITRHKDFKRICDFCRNANVNIDYIKNQPLVDIGGAVLIS